MATKKKPSSEKQLKATIKKLKASLKRADAKATRWQKEAKRDRTTAAKSQARIAKLEKKLAEARHGTSQATSTQHELPSLDEAAVPETTVSADQVTTMPDASWTVVRLRAEARARGLTGMSGKSKAELLAALR